MNTLNAALRNCSNIIKISNTQYAKERLEEAKKVMGITNRINSVLKNIFGHWVKVRITDNEVKKLIQFAMVPNKEVLHNIQSGKVNVLCSCFTNMSDGVFEYAMASPSQRADTSIGTAFAA